MPQHISGQPSYNMSTEALEMPKHVKPFLVPALLIQMSLYSLPKSIRVHLSTLRIGSIWFSCVERFYAFLSQVEAHQASHGSLGLLATLL